MHVRRVLHRKRVGDLDLPTEHAPALRRFAGVREVFDDDGSVILRAASKVPLEIFTLEHQLDIHRQEEKKLGREIPHFAHDADC